MFIFVLLQVANVYSTMTRRKSVCSKWTLVLVVVLLCPYVYSRPQEASPTVTVFKSENVETTENPIRYRYRNSLSTNSYKLPLVTNNLNVSKNNHTSDTNSTKTLAPQFPDTTNNKKDVRNLQNRRSRLVTKKFVVNNKNVRNNRPQSSKTSSVSKNNNQFLTPKTKKTEIKRVITKWTDNTEDLDLTYETTTSDENEIKFTTDISEEYTSTESLNDIIIADSKKTQHKPVNKLLNKLKNKINKNKRPRPPPDYLDDSHEQSDNMHVTATYSYPTTRPMYIFTTPTPTPIITNVGNPMPWPQPTNTHAVYQLQPNLHSVYHKPTTRRPVVVTKPIKNHNYHNPVYHHYPQHPGHEFEVTTFQPTNAYADRIVIRPEEYAASPDECPTIFLTLNNTFQGQGKEACPDLNIAVNTNVVNKNVVVESDEEEADDGIIPDPFGLPFEDSADESHEDHDSDENQEQVESASIEGLALTNYNAAGEGEAASPEAGGYGSPSSILSSYSKPGILQDDDDTFSLSSIANYFKPAINALGWLSTINPLGFGLLSIFLAPIVFLFAGTSGIAALFAPWAFSGREAPTVVHVYRPYWHWDDEIKTWHLHSYPPSRRWDYNVMSRHSKENQNTNTGSIRPTLFYRLKEWMKSTTQTLRQVENRKNKRKKRETWAIRIK